MQQPLFALLGCLVLALPAQLLTLPLSLSLLIHCVGKANMAGAAPVAQSLVSATSSLGTVVKGYGHCCHGSCRAHEGTTVAKSGTLSSVDLS